MAAYSGRFEYRDAHGAVVVDGTCQLHFEGETCTVTPGTGRAITFDLGDVDEATPGDWDLTLRLYTGCELRLKQFGPAFEKMREELLEAWRERTVQCLLLEDLEEIARYAGSAALSGQTALGQAAPAEIRLFQSNVAVLPVKGVPVQWRLADVDDFRFNSESYQAVFESVDQEALVISRLAKKTDEFVQKASGAWGALRTAASVALHTEFPFLNPEQLGKLVRAMPEGRSAKLSQLREVHPKLVDALIARAVDEPLRPYFEELRKRSVEESVMAGFKFIRGDEEDDAAETPEDGGTAAASAGGGQPLFFWFFFPLRDKDLVAWEATTGSGRATYFFQLNREMPVEKQITRLTRGLALINFRREPVYLSDEALDSTPRFHRYAIGARKLEDLRMLRAAYRGRAIHSTFEKWSAQLLGRDSI